jgi:hypothetical protein
LPNSRGYMSFKVYGFVVCFDTNVDYNISDSIACMGW